jgi:hypothetical protein
MPRPLLFLLSIIFLLILLGVGIPAYISYKEQHPENVVGQVDLSRTLASYREVIVHDTISIHDTIYRWDLNQSKLKVKRVKLLCVDSYGTEGLEEGKIYTTTGEGFKSEEGNMCYYIDGIGAKKCSRFAELIK